MAKLLKGIADVRRFFHRNETPIYFISASNFNLLGIDEVRWAKRRVAAAKRAERDGG